MDNDRQKQLEQLVHRELRKLPDLKAPATLIPRVRSAIGARARQSWWQRPMLTWPLAMRAAFIVLLLGILTLASVYGGEIVPAVGVAFQKVAQMYGAFVPIGEQAAALANAFLILAGALSSHFLIYGALLLGVMYLACAGIGTLFYRVTFANR